MSKPELFGGIGSLVIGILFVAFPKPIGVRFCRLGLSIWNRHKDDAVGPITREIRKAAPFDSLQRIYDEKRAPMIFRILGVVFLIQAGVFFILAAAM